MRWAEIKRWEMLELEGRERGWYLIVGYEMIRALSNVAGLCNPC